MSGLLLDDVSHIIGTLLKALELGSNVSEDTDWPIFRGSHPDTPYSSITVYNTAGSLEGKTHVGIETQEFYGFQIKVRSTEDNEQKLRTIVHTLDSVVRESVTTSNATYLIQGVHIVSPISNLGRETSGERQLTASTCNFIVSITKTGEV